MYLIIHTAKQNEIIVALSKNKKIVQLKEEIEFHESERLLPLIDKLLKNNKTDLKELKAVFVVTGPGPFTSLRIGMTVANTLGFSLKIPVVGLKTTEFKGVKKLVEQGIRKLKKKKTKFAFPYYGRKPNITKPKKKWLK